MFKRIVLSACVAGLIAGLVLTGLQRLQVAPLILEAERYEQTGAEAGRFRDGHARGVTPRADAQRPQGGGVFARLSEGLVHYFNTESSWAPAEGWERTFYSAVANVCIAIGFGLLLGAAFSLRGEVRWGQGALWGLAGYAVFFALPAMGLPPELPGTFAAELVHRQSWWLLTVLCSGAGLGLALLRPEWAWKVAGLGLVAVPHLVGAPHPETHGGAAPPELVQSFVWATALVNGVFWVLLGATTAFLFRRLA